MEQIVKINFQNKNFDFSKREKFINVEIQKNIELFNSNGLIVLEHKILNKTNSHASVKFSLKKMI